MRSEAEAARFIAGFSRGVEKNQGMSRGMRLIAYGSGIPTGCAVLDRIEPGVGNAGLSNVPSGTVIVSNLKPLRLCAGS